MAKLDRPRVEVAQQITSAAPTVLTPALIPCIVGPCFQIVDPLDSAGALNTQAQVSTAAILRSSGAVGDPVPLSGLKMKISVDSAPGQVINFPVTILGAPISHVLITNTINVQLTGASAQFQDNKLVITSLSKGASAHLRLEAIASDAYAVLNMVVGLEVSGKDVYSGQDFELPFGSLPSPLAPVEDLQIDGDGVTLYRYFDDTLTPFSKDSSPNWTSRTGNKTSFADSPADSVVRTTRPALGSERTSLFGRLSEGSKTNTLIHLGQEASIDIPLAHDVTNSDTMAFPDVSGLNFLRVEAIGLQNIVKDQANGEPGTFIGVDGNAVSVIFLTEALPSGLGTAKAIWNSGPKLLEIKRNDVTTTFAALKAAVAVTQGLDTTKDLKVTALFDSSVENKPFLPAALPAARFFLGGGEDPSNLGGDQSYIFPTFPGVQPSARAGFSGAVEYVGGTLAADLGIDGEKFAVSIDGQEFIEVTLTGAVDAQLSTIPGLFAKSSGIVSPDDDGIGIGVGTTVNVLQLQTDVGADGPDSTLEIRTSARVVERLFGGFKGQTETPVTAFSLGAFDERRAILASQTDFNKRAVTAREIALSPGSLDMTFSNVKLPGLILVDVDTTAFDAPGPPVVFDMKMEHSAVAAFTAACTFSLIEATLTSIVDGIIAGIDAILPAHLISIGVSVLGNRIAFFDKTTAVGATMELITAGVGPTDPAVVAAFGGAAVFDVVSTTTDFASFRVQDKGNNFALRVTEVSNNLNHAVLPASGSVDGEDEDDLTALILSASESAVLYSTGVITVTTSGDSTDVPATRKPIVVAIKDAGGFVSDSPVSIAYKRVWASATSPGSPVYRGRIFMGGTVKALPGDTVFNNGITLGRVRAINDYVIGTKVFPGAEIQISEFSVDNNATLASWYIIAEDLPDTLNRGGLSVEMVVDEPGKRITVKGALNRDGNGLPIAGNAALYVGFKALRRDVSADTTSASLLVFNSADEVEALIGPVSTENPLAFGLSKAFLNRTNISISALGISEVTPDAPNGTIDAYAQALDFLRKKEVYAIAPLVQNPGVTALFSQHVTDMSAATQGKERIAFVSEALPTEKVSTLVISGNMLLTDVGGGKFELRFSDNTLNLSTAINGTLNSNGDALSGAIGTVYAPEDGIFIDRAGDAFRWLVTKLVDASTVEIDTNDVYLPGFGPGSGGNGDAYFQTNAAILGDFEADGETTAVQVRQAAVTTDTAAARLEVCEVMAEITGGPSGYINRRLFWMQPEKVGTDEGGTEVLVEGFYIAAAECARVAQFPPQQGHTNMPLVGFTRPVGSSDLFEEDEMATAASGGVWWTIQDAPGGPLAPRHQLSTDTSSVKTQELSITKPVDLFAKAIRAQIRSGVGRNNITKSFLETLSIALQGVIARFAGTNRPLSSASLSQIGQSTTRVDGIEVVADVTTFIPVNNIRVTIVS